MKTEYVSPAMLIDGEWVEGKAGDPVIDPATEAVLGYVPRASRADLDRALAAAARSFPVWKGLAPARRAELMTEAARLLRQRAPEIAKIVTLEHGKPLAESRTEILRAADLVEWDANEGRRAYGRIVPGPPGFRQTVLREPIGPVAAFTPWNFPVSAPGRKVGGALASGCSIILKASEETPGGACAFVRCFVDAGIPPGVVNLVFGNPAEISEYLIASPAIRLVTFTGSAPVGKHLTQMAGALMKPVIMELGGHSPVIICEDADPAVAARVSAAGKFRNAGQVCVSPTRFFVQQRSYERFVESFVAEARKIKVGNGFEEGVQMGPLANPRRLEAMERLLADAKQKGAIVETGGHRIHNAGFFFAPTVLTRVPAEAELMNVEPFGPIAPILPFDELNDAIAMANSLPYGLAAYAFTHSAENVAALSDGVETGLLSINHVGGGVPEAPFGGVKDSGMGREGGIESLDGYMITKFVSHFHGAPTAKTLARSSLQ